MTLTPRGIGLLVGAVLLWALGRAFGIDELAVVAVAAAGLVAVGALVVVLMTSTVSARRWTSGDRLLCGADGEVVVELRNDARLPAAVLLVSDECAYGLAPAVAGGDGPRFVVPGMRPGGTVTLRYGIRGQHRGRYTVGPLRIRVRDPFGCVERVRRFGATDEVLVYPPIEALPEGAVRGAHHGGGSSDTRRLQSTGDEFYTMREYVRGDDLRHVHWPSTAHRQVLMVRQQEQPWEAVATVVCDTRTGAHRGSGPDSTLEKAISVAASAVWHLADRGYRLRLVTERDTRLAPLQPWQALLDTLAEVQGSRVPALTPALAATRGAEGLLVAVVAPPPGRGPVAADPDVTALLQVGRRASGGIAVVLDTDPLAPRGAPRGASAPAATGRAQQLAGLLTAAGWRATVVGPRQPLAGAWLRMAATHRPPRAATTAGGTTSGSMA